MDQPTFLEQPAHTQSKKRPEKKMWKRSIPLTLLIIQFLTDSSSAFQQQLPSQRRLHRLHVSELEKVKDTSDTENDSNKDKKGYVIPPASKTLKSDRAEEWEEINSSMYESTLLTSWETNQASQSGFDWEIEKLRRYFGGLRQLPDGKWVRKPSLLDFLVSRTAISPDTSPKPVNLLDVIALVSVNLLTSIGFGPSLGMSAVPDAVIQKYEGSFLSFITGVLGGDLQTLAGGPLFLLLAKYYESYGPIFNLSFGPKSFLVVSDPVMSRYILREARVDQYCKGMLADILEPIMGQGLIPADPKTWKVRRRVLVPGFHKRWLNRMITLFADCSDTLLLDLSRYPDEKNPVPLDMEERFCSVTLDIIGKAVFNYDFGSTKKESPVIKAVYRVLREAENRANSFIPYWNLPYANKWMGGQVEFRRNMGILDDILSELINNAVETRKEASVEELEQRELDDENPSLLRFLVDMRGEDVNSVALRDDLMTMLIAGHETTAAMLTWTLFELSQADPGMMREIQAEVDSVMDGKSRPDYDDIVKMERLRYALIEALRLYPEPPLLIRRARIEDTLPTGGSGISPDGIKILRGTDIFISTWNLHRSNDLWENASKYDPTRWERPFSNASVKGWKGYNPDKISGLYPNEIATDHAFLPFGGGQRKCIGDQFAMMEATVTMAMVIKNFEFTFATKAEDVGMQTGATIHTMNGLNMIVKKRSQVQESDGWWERQHLQRGLGPNGRPHESGDKAHDTNKSNGKSGGCPVQH